MAGKHRSRNSNSSGGAPNRAETAPVAPQTQHRDPKEDILTRHRQLEEIMQRRPAPVVQQVFRPGSYHNVRSRIM